MAVYAVCRPHRRAAVIAAGGVAVCAWGSLWGALLLTLSAAAAYTGGILINNFKEKRGISKLILTVCCVINGIIFLLFSRSLYSPPDMIPMSEKFFRAVGASVYTLHSISYCADIFRGRYAAQIRFSEVFAFVGFMPCLNCGPILRYDEISETLDAPKIRSDLLADGILLYLYGLSEKIIIADRLAALQEEIRSMGAERVSAPTAWLGAAVFGAWFCFELSGFFHMARGFALMLGFELKKCYIPPLGSYELKSCLTGINPSLSEWLYDYIVLPLKGKAVPAALAAAVAGGLWYGTSRSFLVWSVMAAAVIALETLLKKPLGYLPKVLRVMLVISAAVICGGVLSGGSYEEGILWLGAMFGSNPTSTENTTWYFLRSYAPTLIPAVLLLTPLPEKFTSRFGQQFIPAARPAIILALLILCTSFMLSEPQMAEFMF